MENDKIDLRKYIAMIKRNWLWLVAVFFIVMGMAVTYCVIKMPQYKSTSMLLIENDSEDGGKSMGGMMGVMKTFSIGGFGSSSIDNELLILQSHALKKNMIGRLGLNRTYVERNGLFKTLLYKESPVLVDAPAAFFDTLQTGFKIRIELKDGKADIKASKGFLGTVIATKKNAMLPCTFETPYGYFQILKTDNYNPNDNRIVDVVIQGNDLAVGAFDKKVLEITYANKKSDGIILEILDPSKERGRDILNTLMSMYNERRQERRNERAVADVAFLDERIEKLGRELAESEAEIEQFKKDKELVDVETELPLLLEQDISADNELIQLRVKEITLESILNQLMDENKQYSLIPMTESFGDGNAAAVFGSYNNLVLKRLSMMSSAKDGNVALKQITEQLDVMRENAIENVKRLQKQCEIKKNQLKKESLKYKSRIDNLPKYEREFSDLARNRELKNAIYVFLLEKRESALLKQNNTTELGFIFEPAYSAIKPYKVKLYIILAAGFVCAILAGLVMALFVGFVQEKRKK